MSKIVSFFLPVLNIVKGLFSFTKTQEKPTSLEVRVEYEKYIHRDEQKLKAFYDEQKDPGVSFRVFYLRVWIFDWSYSDALKAPESKHRTVILGKDYDIQEVYDSCKDPKVSYNTFYTRVVRSQWKPLRALSTPPSR